MLSIIHYFEHIYKVPYRFTKEFKINYVKNSKLISTNFKLDVLKKNLDIQKII